MSYSFYVPVSKVPAIDQLLGGFDQAEVQVVVDKSDATWPDARITLCQRFRSTRGVRLSYNSGEIEIKLNVFSAPEDGQLAVQLAVVAANVAESIPRAEYIGPMPPDQLLVAHDETWIRESLSSGLRVLKTLIKDRGRMGMPGPFRTCYIGPRMLEEAGREGDAAAIEGLLAAMRRVQWIHLDGYDAASEFAIDNSKERLAFWFPLKRMFLPCV